MPKVTVDHKSNLSTQDAFEKIQKFFENDQDIRRLDPSIKCDFKAGDMKGKVNGSQFKADISVTGQGQGSTVTVVVDLPLLLTPFKGKVQETIEKKLNKYLV